MSFKKIKKSKDRLLQLTSGRRRDRSPSLDKALASPLQLVAGLAPGISATVDDIRHSSELLDSLSASGSLDAPRIVVPRSASRPSLWQYDDHDGGGDDVNALSLPDLLFDSDRASLYSERGTCTQSSRAVSESPMLIRRMSKVTEKQISNDTEIKT